MGQIEKIRRNVCSISLLIVLTQFNPLIFSFKYYLLLLKQLVFLKDRLFEKLVLDPTHQKLMFTHRTLNAYLYYYILNVYLPYP